MSESCDPSSPNWCVHLSSCPLQPMKILETSPQYLGLYGRQVFSSPLKRLNVTWYQKTIDLHPNLKSKILRRSFEYVVQMLKWAWVQRATFIWQLYHIKHISFSPKRRCHTLVLVGRHMHLLDVSLCYDEGRGVFFFY